jgi:hypothetical protein
MELKKVLLVATAFLIGFTGCKKDDETYATFSLATTSMDFEWSQSKELTFSAHKITSHNTPTAPAGWMCVFDGAKYIITSPSEGSAGASQSGAVTISVTTDAGTTLTRTVSVAIKIAEEIASGPANSYIITEGGKRFKFKADRRGGETEATIKGAAIAVRYWTTDAEAVFNVSLENGYVYFATSGTATSPVEGNAMIVIGDSNENLLWSWHVWVVKDDPRLNPDEIGSMRVMNRNLGAFVNSDSSADNALLSYGLYYQWGRKDPFVGPSTWNSTASLPIYNVTGRYVTHNFTTSSSDTGNVAYSIANPGTFIAGSKDNGFNWLTSPDNTLWSETSKTIYDPCPSGWRVAPRALWASLTTVTGEYKYGVRFENGAGTVFFPAAGRRSFSPSLSNASDNYTNVVNNADGVGNPVGFYWSSSAPANGSLAFGVDYLNSSATRTNIAETAAAGAFPVRCIAEN